VRAFTRYGCFFSRAKNTESTQLRAIPSAVIFGQPKIRARHAGALLKVANDTVARFGRPFTSVLGLRILGGSSDKKRSGVGAEVQTICRAEFDRC